MSFLENIETEVEIAEEADRLGGGGPVDTGIYPSTITLAYAGESKGGAKSITVHLATDEGRELRQTIYVTSGKAKGQKPFYERNGERHWLPGYSLSNHLALCSTGKELKSLATEAKTINLWNGEARKEVPTEVQVFSDLINQKVIAAVWKQIVDKNQLNEATGNYEPTGETREENEIEKFFHAETRMTVAEAKGGNTEGTFIDSWAEKYAGEVKDKSTKVAANSPAGAAPAAAAGAKPAGSIFG